jgi:K+-sensing histidine kinase KdpD
MVLHAIDSHLPAEHLILGYLFPTILIAIYYGSSVAVFTSFASGIAAAYFLFPPKFSFYIADITNVAELGFFLLLASIASKAVSVLAEDGHARNITKRD